MRIEYSNRAVDDLRKLADSSLHYGEAVSIAVETRLRRILDHIAAHPQAAEQISDRPGVHVVPLVRYPYKVFYRVLKDRILHIRHTSRKPWTTLR